MCSLCQSYFILLQGLAVRHREGRAFADQVGVMLYCLLKRLITYLFILVLHFCIKGETLDLVSSSQ